MYNMYKLPGPLPRHCFSAPEVWPQELKFTLKWHFVTGQQVFDIFDKWNNMLTTTLLTTIQLCENNMLTTTLLTTIQLMW